MSKKNIEECIIKVKTKEGLKHVENICFRNGIVWRWSGKKHITYGRTCDNVMYIHVTSHLSLISNMGRSDYDTLSKFTVIQFAAKYGKSPKYRIKTKQEFIDEFGDNWRREVRFAFVSGMDSLFGKELTSVQVKELNEDYTNMASYSICKDMVTTKKSSKKKTIKKTTITDKVCDLIMPRSPGIIPYKFVSMSITKDSRKRKKTYLNQDN